MTDIKEEFEYKKLKQLLNRLSSDRKEKFAETMAEKIYHSGRGGYRGGKKPKLPEHLRREPVNARIQKWMIDALKADGDLGPMLEKLILDAGYKPPEEK